MIAPGPLSLGIFRIITTMTNPGMRYLLVYRNRPRASTRERCFGYYQYRYRRVQTSSLFLLIWSSSFSFPFLTLYFISGDLSLSWTLRCFLWWSGCITAVFGFATSWVCIMAFRVCKQLIARRIGIAWCMRCTTKTVCTALGLGAFEPNYIRLLSAPANHS